MSDHEQSDRSRASAREAAEDVVRTLTEAGHIAYFAGGCVRDEIMGHEPDDYDVATNARPQQVRTLFHRTQEVGASFGVVLVRYRRRTTQVATFRIDGVYADGRHPESIEFGDAEHDARRRDFTINGLFENPLTNEIIDYVGGRADIDHRIIRAIGDPMARFREDHLRMLRAIRFAARFEFSIEPDTADAIRQLRGDLRGVSRERIGQEIRRMLCDPNRAVAAWELQYLGLDESVLGEEHICEAPTILGRLPEHAPYAAALAAWAIDRHGLACLLTDRGAAVAARWTRSLMLAGIDSTGMRQTLALLEQIRAWRQMGVARQKRLAVSRQFNNAMMILQAADRDAFVEMRQRVCELEESGLSPARFIDGEDLIGIGMTPGPAFQVILEAVYDAQLEGSVENREQALALAKAVATTRTG